LFLLSSIVFASATVATGVWWVDWKPARGTRVALVPGAGVSLVAQHDF
jgi:hypothetical protein